MIGRQLNWMILEFFPNLVILQFCSFAHPDDLHILFLATCYYMFFFNIKLYIMNLTCPGDAGFNKYSSLEMLCTCTILAI